MTYVANACSKFILGGEHAVVHGAHAIAVPLFSKHLELDLKASHEDSELVLSGHKKNSSISDVLLDLKAITPISLNPEELNFSAFGNCSIPVGAGLGASAALCVALARAHLQWASAKQTGKLEEIFEHQQDKQKIQQMAHILEKRFHGSPSGIDTAVISYEQPILYQKQEGLRFAANEFSMPRFALVDSGVRSSTKQMVQGAKPYFAGSKGVRLVRRFDLVTLDMWKALHQKDHNGLIETIQENQSLLGEIGVVGSHCQQVCDAMLELGVDSVKVTGAGSGGFILGLLPKEKQKADAIIASLRRVFGDGAVIDTNQQRSNYQSTTPITDIQKDAGAHYVQ